MPTAANNQSIKSKPAKVQNIRLRGTSSIIRSDALLPVSKKKMHCTTSASESTETRKATVQSPRLHDLSENTAANAITQTYAETMTVHIWSSNLHQLRLHRTVEIWACKCTVVLSLGVLFCFAGLPCNPTTTASPEKYHGGRQILFESFEFQGGCF